MTTWIIVGVVVVLFLTQRRNVMRILAALGAQFGKLSRFIWRADPVAVYQSEVDRAAEELSDARKGLDEYSALVESMKRAITNGKKDVELLTVKVKSSLTTGDENRASEYAIQLKKAEGDLQEKSQQLSLVNETFQNNLKKIQYAKQKITDANEKARRLQAELRLSKVDAETASLAERFDMKVNQFDGLGEVEAEIQRQIDVNRGKSQVSRELSRVGLEEIEAEESLRREEAKEVLDKMKAEMGLSQKN